MDVGVISEQALLVGVIEVSAMVNGGLFAGSAAEDLGAPCVTERRLADYFSYVHD